MISYAQEVEHESPIKHHRVSIVLGHTHIPKGFNMDSTSFALIVPSWGLNYEFWFNQKWVVGIPNDMEISVYAIEDHDGEE